MEPEPILNPANLSDMGVRRAIEPGWIVWRQASPELPLDGGVVTDTFDRVDAETGESKRAYSVITTGAKMRLFVVDEADLEVPLTQPYSTAKVVTVLRRIAQEIYKPPTARAPVSGGWTEHHSQLARKFCRLEAVVNPGRSS